MKISIISTVFNKEKFLENHIKSLISQDYINLEIIFVDDGSKDNSYKIVNKYAKRDNRIVVLKQKNSGPSSARKTGFLHATGEIIYFVDSDDVIANQNTISLVAKKFKDNKIDLLIGKMINDYGYKKEEDRIIFPNLIEGKYKIDVLYDQLIRGSLCCKFFKKDLIDETFFIDSRNFEDSYFSYQYYKKVKKLYFLDKSVYVCNYNSNDTSNSSLVNERMFQDKYRVLNDLIDDLGLANFEISLKKLYLKQYIDDLINTLKRDKNATKKIIEFVRIYSNQSFLRENQKYVKFLNKKYQFFYKFRYFLLNSKFNSIISNIYKRRVFGCKK